MPAPRMPLLPLPLPPSPSSFPPPFPPFSFLLPPPSPFLARARAKFLGVGSTKVVVGLGGIVVGLGGWYLSLASGLGPGRPRGAKAGFPPGWDLVESGSGPSPGRPRGGRAGSPPDPASGRVAAAAASLGRRVDRRGPRGSRPGPGDRSGGPPPPTSSSTPPSRAGGGGGEGGSHGGEPPPGRQGGRGGRRRGREGVPGGRRRRRGGLPPPPSHRSPSVHYHGQGVPGHFWLLGAPSGVGSPRRRGGGWRAPAGPAAARWGSGVPPAATAGVRGRRRRGGGPPGDRRRGGGWRAAAAAARCPRVPARLRPTPRLCLRGGRYRASPYKVRPAARCVSASTRCAQ